MAALRKDRCGTRHRRQTPEHDVCPLPDGQDVVGLTPLGHALLDALRDDPRYRDIIADPFGDHGTGN
jgi:hypothetical protein